MCGYGSVSRYQHVGHKISVQGIAPIDCALLLHHRQGYVQSAKAVAKNKSYGHKKSSQYLPVRILVADKLGSILLDLCQI